MITVTKPIPASGQALVKVHAFGLNRMDLLQREGKYPVPPQAGPILGVEFSGTIESFGDVDVNDQGGFNKGDSVFGLAYGGAYAEYIVVSTRMLLHKPDFLSWEEAAGIPEVFLTATQALHLIGVFEQGKTVLWHAGASAVSIAGIQMAKIAGASAIYVTAGSKDKIDFCVNGLGATAGFNYKSQDWSKEILEATDGKGVDLIIDFIGGPYFQGNLNAAAMDGVIVSLGMMGGPKCEKIDLRALINKRIRFQGSTLRSRDLNYQAKLRDSLQENMEAFRTGKLKAFVERIFDWRDVVKAHELMESNRTRGKIVCTITG